MKRHAWSQEKGGSTKPGRRVLSDGERLPGKVSAACKMREAVLPLRGA